MPNKKAMKNKQRKMDFLASNSVVVLSDIRLCFDAVVESRLQVQRPMRYRAIKVIIRSIRENRTCSNGIYPPNPLLTFRIIVVFVSFLGLGFGFRLVWVWVCCFFTHTHGPFLDHLLFLPLLLERIQFGIRILWRELHQIFSRNPIFKLCIKFRNHTHTQLNNINKNKTTKIWA